PGPVADPEPVPTPEPEPVVEATPEPEPEPEPELTLPNLNESDAFISEQLQPLAEPRQLGLIVSEELVRKLVRAVMGAAENRLVNQYRPVMSPLPNLEVEQISSGPEAEYRLKTSNYQRYDDHIALMQAIPPATLAKRYRDLQPLFEEAYAEQGLEGDFDEVLLKAIDQLLATPEVEGPLRLTRPAVMYKFADPRLERLTDPQKLLLRIGPEHRARVKAYLTDLKAELTKSQ
ncbi:MAG TPA: DUF3014 domain-containing protein, partial [Cellvibrionaceae bacterium]